MIRDDETHGERARTLRHIRPVRPARPSAGATVGGVECLGRDVYILASFYNARPAAIYGGSNEIQRNILASQVLGLPG